MIIRPVVKEDFPQVLDLIHEFQNESLDSYSLFCNDDKAMKLMEVVYENALVMVENRVVGVIAGAIGQSMVSTDPVMQELIFYISKEFRGEGTKLLKAFEQLARDRNCRSVLMVFMGNLNRRAMERYYTRQGYDLLECQYIKCLKPN